MDKTSLDTPHPDRTSLFSRKQRATLPDRPGDQQHETVQDPSNAMFRRLFTRGSAFQPPQTALQRRLGSNAAQSHQRRRSPRMPVQGWTVEIEGQGYPVKNWNLQGFLATSCVVDYAPGDTIGIHFSVPLTDGQFKTMRRASIVRIDPSKQELAGVFTTSGQKEAGEDSHRPFGINAAEFVTGATSDAAAPSSIPTDNVAVSLISLERVVPNSMLTRERDDREAIEELAASIKDRGVLQPILVRPHPVRADAFEIIAGGRRRRAAMLAGLVEIPAVIRMVSDDQVLETALIENLQREDLSPLEEAEGYSRLIDEYEHTQEALAHIIRRSRSHIANRLRLRQLTPEIQTMLQAEQLTAGHARALLTAENPGAMAQQILAGNLNVRQTEAMIRQAKTGTQNGHSAKMTERDGLASVEQDLSALLGLTVRISERRKGGGVLSFRYDRIEQCNALIRKLVLPTSALSNGDKDH